MAPHQPSANAIPAPTIYTLLVSTADDIFFPIHFQKSIIMTEHVDYEPKGCVTSYVQEFECIDGAAIQYRCTGLSPLHG